MAFNTTDIFMPDSYTYAESNNSTKEAQIVEGKVLLYI